MVVDTKHILAVIVLYNLDLRKSTTICSINAALVYCNAYLDVVIYDNSLSSDETRKEFTFDRLHIHYIHDSSNAGVSQAYNTGALYASTLTNKKWLFFLDQDTFFAPDVLIRYAEAMVNHPKQKLYAPILMLSDTIIFSPCRYFFKRGFPLKRVSAGLSTLRNVSPVNSGMLVDLDLFFKAGMYNKFIKLDFSDFDFIERFRKLESKFVIVNTIGKQDFSNNEPDINKLNIRYRYFCEGAKHCTKTNFIDELQYLFVVFLRATSLSLRSRSLIFYKTFFKSYLFC